MWFQKTEVEDVNYYEELYAKYINNNQLYHSYYP